MSAPGLVTCQREPNEPHALDLHYVDACAAADCDCADPTDPLRDRYCAGPVDVDALTREFFRVSMRTLSRMGPTLEGIAKRVRCYADLKREMVAHGYW